MVVRRWGGGLLVRAVRLGKENRWKGHSMYVNVIHRYVSKVCVRWAVLSSVDSTYQKIIGRNRQSSKGFNNFTT